jgi:hypothetical protein
MNRGRRHGHSDAQAQEEPEIQPDRIADERSGASIARSASKCSYRWAIGALPIVVIAKSLSIANLPKWSAGLNYLLRGYGPTSAYWLLTEATLDNGALWLEPWGQAQLYLRVRTFVFNGESWGVCGDRKSQSAWRSKIDGAKIIAVERRGDVKPATCHYLGHLAQSVGIGNSPRDVVYDARTRAAGSVVRRAQKIDGDWLSGRPIAEPEDGSFMSRRLKPERFREKAGGMLEAFDLDFYGSNPPYRVALRIGRVSSGAAL